MPQTITSFFSFASFKKRRSSEVNTNFSNWRGTLLPFNEDTLTTSDATHNLGTSEHTWAEGYINNLNFKHLTTTTNFSFDRLTAGAVQLLGQQTSTGLQPMRIDESGYRGLQITTTNRFTTAALNTFEFIEGTFGSLNAVSTYATLCAFRQNLKTGSFVELGYFGFVAGYETTGGQVDFDLRVTGGYTGASGYYQVRFGPTTTSLTLGATFVLSPDSNANNFIPFPALRFLLLSVGSGEVYFEIQHRTDTSTAGFNVNGAGRFYCYER